MRSNEFGVLLSASDLMRFSGCAHATTLDLAWMKGVGSAPADESEDAELLQRHGDAHEARHLARLSDAGRGVVEIVTEGASPAQGFATRGWGAARRRCSKLMWSCESEIPRWVQKCRTCAVRGQDAA